MIITFLQDFINIKLTHYLNNFDFFSNQGEYQLRLRELEKELLDKLNNVQGRILDDDSVITALETLKKEADQVQEKVLETDVIMGEVTSVSMKYEPLARSCSDIFFTLESMSQLHFLYQVQLFSCEFSI